MYNIYRGIQNNLLCVTFIVEIQNTTYYRNIYRGIQNTIYYV